MYGQSGKGGKNRRRGKNENEETKRELEFKEAGQEYAQVNGDVMPVGLISWSGVRAGSRRRYDHLFDRFIGFLSLFL